MSAPSSYTEQTLTTYIRDDVLKGSAVTLGWTSDDPALPPWRGIIRATLRLCNTTEVTTVNAVLLEAASAVAAWDAVLDEVALMYAYSDNAVSFDRDQMTEQATQRRDRAIQRWHDVQTDQGRSGIAVLGRIVTGTGYTPR